MSNILEKIKKHFRDTPREKILGDLEKVKKTSRRGPNIGDLLEFHLECVKWKIDNIFVLNKNNSKLANPKYKTSGSLFKTIPLWKFRQRFN